MLSLYVAQNVLNDVHVGYTDNVWALTGLFITITSVAQVQKGTKNQIVLTMEGA